MDDRERFQVIASTRDGQVYEREVWAATALDAAEWLVTTLELGSGVTNLHVRRV